MAAYNNPQKALVEAVRGVIPGADRRVTEAVKWQAPSFVYKGSIVSFFSKAKAHVSLLFHKGGGNCRLLSVAGRRGSRGADLEAERQRRPCGEAGRTSGNHPRLVRPAGLTRAPGSGSAGQPGATGPASQAVFARSRRT